MSMKYIKIIVLLDQLYYLAQSFINPMHSLAI